MGILDFLYPKRCVGCKKTGNYLCASCLSLAKLHFPQVCPICEKSAIDGSTHPRCKKTTSPDGLFAIYSYEGNIRKLITKLKYQYISDIAKTLSTEAIKILKKSPFLTKNKLTLVPVPLYWTRKNWRGFNQAEEIGRIISRGMDWQAANLLIRKKSTKFQVGLTEKERQKNIKNAFIASPDIQMSRHPNILLFDDVWTTGATMLEAARVLKRAGADKVWCLTLARRA